MLAGSGAVRWRFVLCSVSTAPAALRQRCIAVSDPPEIHVIWLDAMIDGATTAAVSASSSPRSAARARSERPSNRMDAFATIDAATSQLEPARWRHSGRIDSNQSSRWRASNQGTSPKTRTSRLGCPPVPRPNV